LQFTCRTSLWGVMFERVGHDFSPLSYNAASVVSNLHGLDLEFVNTRNAQETETNIERRRVIRKIILTEN
jgi:hypothetical protein